MKQKLMNATALLLGLVFCCSVTNSSFATNRKLLPPWYLLNNQLSALLNADSCVHVEDLTGEGRDMEIIISVCNEDKAQALAAFLNRTHDFGHLAVTVKVYTAESVPVNPIKPNDIKETVEMLNRALTGNKYFVKAGIGSTQQSEAAFAIFQPKVIQYYSDDISDWYLNTNEVASKVFSDVFNFNPFAEDAVRIYATTAMTDKNVTHAEK
jgi:hypothetical protein